MLKKIQKFFNASVAEAATENKEPDMVKEDTADLSAQLAEAQANLAKVSADLQAATELAEEMAAKFAEAETAKAALVAEAAAKRMEARNKIIADKVGTAKAEHLLKATESLGDEQFNAVVDAMALTFEKEAESLLFNEVGVAAKAAPQEEVKEDVVGKLAAKLAAEFNPN